MTSTIHNQNHSKHTAVDSQPKKKESFLEEFSKAINNFAIAVANRISEFFGQTHANINVTKSPVNTAPEITNVAKRLLQENTSTSVHTVTGLQIEDLDTSSIIDIWVKQASPEEKREEAAKRIKAILDEVDQAQINGGLGEDLILDLEGLNLSSLPNIFDDDRFKSVEQIFLNNNFFDDLPDSLYSVQANMVSLYSDYDVLPSACQKRLMQENELVVNQRFHFQETRPGLTTHEKLEIWESKANPGENRKEAVRIIEEFLTSNDSKKIDLSGLNLKTIPNVFGDEKFSRLENLNLSNNQLTEFPVNTYPFSRLKDLNLDNNNFVSLPETVDIIGCVQGSCTITAQNNPLDNATKNMLFNLLVKPAAKHTIYFDGILQKIHDYQMQLHALAHPEAIDLEGTSLETSDEL